MPLNQFSGKQVKSQTLSDTHIAANAAIQESKLSINWNTHYHNALAAKKLLDYVQMMNLAVTAGNANITIAHAAGGIGMAFHTSNPDGLGVVDTKPVLMRDTATGSPIVVNDREVFGVLSYDEAGDQYIIAFATGTMETPTYVNMPAGIAAIDLQYMARFNLDLVDEAFAANEKFVDGMADVTDTANLLQIAKDAFGASYTLDHDGAANLSKSLAETIVIETSGAANTAARAKDIIDEVIAARDAFASVDERIGDAERRVNSMEAWKAAQNTNIHRHVDEVGVTVAGTSHTFVRQDIKSTDFLAVYLNGARQYPGLNYDLQINGGIVTGLSFHGDLEADWDIYIEAVIYNS